MDKKQQLLLTWSGLIFVITFCVGVWFVAGLVPPHSPGASATEIAAFYQSHPGRIRTGLLITMFAATMWIPWAAVFSAQLKCMRQPTLADVQFGCGIATSCFVILPVMVWWAAAFRHDRDPEILLMFNDFAYLTFVGMVPAAFIQISCIGFAVLSDGSASPIFPRWVGYYNLWTALLTLTGGFCTYFKVGPFAWNGWIAFWLPMAVYGIWYPLMFVLVRRAIRSADSIEHEIGLGAGLSQQAQI